MKIGTLSFAQQDENSMCLKGECRVQIIKKICCEYSPDLLVCAGYSVDNEQQVYQIAEWLGNNKSNTGILLEDSVQGKNAQKKGKADGDTRRATYFICPNGQVNQLGRQAFTRGRDATRNLCILNQQLCNRSFEFFSRRFLVLICGEIMSLTVPENGRRAAEFRDGEKSPLKQYWENAQIILNPTHDRMRRHEPRVIRKFLSGTAKNPKVVICVSNWNMARNQKPGALTNHHVFVGGKEICAVKKHIPDNKEYEYREWCVN